VSQPAVIVENLGKRYKIGRPRPAGRTWRTALGAALRAPFARSRAPDEVGHDSAFIWALRDASFEVRPGEVVGVIGRNGSGKSTLLKILSRVVTPTTGRALVAGRIGTLLEVGTGFHPELTGRENIYLNGAILGMTRHEVRRKFDEIVAFAETERFLDVPVKRYSSGMYVRLAFAVAAHLDPEVLIVDEVLAVGDAAFQKKCLAKIAASARNGRTILFVSHNMVAVRQLCRRALLMEQGRITQIGDVGRVIESYCGTPANPQATFARAQAPAIADECWVAEVWLEQNGHKVATVRNGAPAVLCLVVQAERDTALVFEVLIRDQDQRPVLWGPADVSPRAARELPRGRHAARLLLDLPHLVPGRYYLDVMLAEAGRRFIDYVECAVALEVEAGLSAATEWTFCQSRGPATVLLPIPQVSVEPLPVDVAAAPREPASELLAHTQR
jgi:lipopolysaccharide transport system ATP-binding protein